MPSRGDGGGGRVGDRGALTNDSRDALPDRCRHGRHPRRGLHRRRAPPHGPHRRGPRRAPPSPPAPRSAAAGHRTRWRTGRTRPRPARRRPPTSLSQCTPSSTREAATMPTTAAAPAANAVRVRGERPRARQSAAAAQHAAAAVACPLGYEYPPAWTSWSMSGRVRSTISFRTFPMIFAPPITSSRKSATRAASPRRASEHDEDRDHDDDRRCRRGPWRRGGTASRRGRRGRRPTGPPGGRGARPTSVAPRLEPHGTHGQEQGDRDASAAGRWPPGHWSGGAGTRRAPPGRAARGGACSRSRARGRARPCSGPRGRRRRWRRPRGPGARAQRSARARRALGPPRSRSTGCSPLAAAGNPGVAGARRTIPTRRGARA